MEVREDPNPKVVDQVEVFDIVSKDYLVLRINVIEGGIWVGVDYKVGIGIVSEEEVKKEEKLEAKDEKNGVKGIKKVA